MFGTIRKHQTWLWAIIITVIIISFVWYFGPTSRLDQGGRRASYDYGTINGKKVTEDAFFNAQREVYLQFFFNRGEWPDKQTGFEEERETYYWLFLIQKQEQLGIRVGGEAAAQEARMVIRSLTKGQVETTEFIKRVLEPRRITPADLERYFRHSLGLKELVSTVALSGLLISPSEAREFYQREFQELATEAVWFSASNYVASVAVTPAALSSYYSNAQANYRIPQRVQVSYVEFPLTNYLAAAEADLKTNLVQIIDNEYRKMGTNAYKGLTKPEEIKAKLREDIIRYQAATNAKRKAAEFAVQLEDMANRRKEALGLGASDREMSQPEDLNVLAKTNGLIVKVSAPFDSQSGPSEFEVEAKFTRDAFKMSRTNQPIRGPFTGEIGSYVIAFNRVLESEIPSLDAIRDRVTSDYRYLQAVKLANEAGIAFQTRLTNSLAQGKTFSAACAESKLTPVQVPPFSLATRSIPDVEGHINLASYKDVAFSTQVGKVSPFRRTSEGGVIVHVKSKQPVDQSKMIAELPAFLNSVRQSRQSEVFNDWFRREAEASLRTVPFFSRPPEGQRKKA